MDATELIKKVRKIEIKSRGISNQLFSGEYHSVFKGKGMTFSEVREYIPGDDIRLIDWNVTARFNHPYVKIFQEERELTVMLIVDLSASESFGTINQFKKDLITELCAVIAFSALLNNDKIGVIFFTDKIEKYIPPKKGKTHVLRIIRELLEFTPEGKKTDVNDALRFFSNVIKKRSISFILSDFISRDFESSLKIAARKHDTIAVKIYDPMEEILPNLGLVQIYEPELGKFVLIDTSNRKTRNQYNEWRRNTLINLVEIFQRNSIDMIKIRTDESYIAPLRNFFKMRSKRK